MLVKLYMENACKTPKEQDGWYGYVLSYQGKTLHTIEEIDTYKGTRHRRDLYMFLRAISRCKDCSILVHTDSAYLKGGYDRMEQYAKNDWKKTTGEPVKNADLWQQVLEKSQGKEVTFIYGQHEYTDWLKSEIRRRHAETKKDNTGTEGTGLKP